MAAVQDLTYFERKAAGEKARPIFFPSSDKRNEVQHIALIGGHAPRKCGIATYTDDIVRSLKANFPAVRTDIYAIARSTDFRFDEGTAGVIVENDISTYRQTARAIEASGADVIWLQHEFGLFGGRAGDHILELLAETAAPLVVTLHTILAEPDIEQKRVMKEIVRRASTLFVMSMHARQMLIDIYAADEDQVVFVPHGVPDRPFGRSGEMKAKLGIANSPMLMTFGLISPGKGIECAIEALPAILAQHPSATYYIVGATHPNLIAHEGEAYRDRLEALSKKLGVEDNIVWINRFLDNEELLDWIEAADIYLTPYPGAAQATSGTLSYAVALGKAVISTPYVHARELLADDHGILVPFNDCGAIADAVNDLLSTPATMARLQQRAFRCGRTMLWSNFAARSMEAISQIVVAAPLDGGLSHGLLPRELPIEGLVRICDDTGILQHSRHSIPDRAHGYCVDDNARALMLMNRIDWGRKSPLPQLATIFASFVQDAWNADLGTFRNFMDFRRNWLEDTGSEDSCARAFWSLGATAHEGQTAELKRWAHDMFDQTASSMRDLSSPRAMAFAALGAYHMLSASSGSAVAKEILERTSERLEALLCTARRPDWAWFEHVLAYDNCRLPEALIRAGLRLDRPDYVECGLETLEWIMEQQTAPAGHFRPVGADSFGRELSAPRPYDQQPVEAWAAVDAAEAAYAATRDDKWVDRAIWAFGWFTGNNDRGLAVGDLTTGTCRDGLNPRGLNLNEGAESVLSFHLAYATLRKIDAASTDIVATAPIAIASSER